MMPTNIERARDAFSKKSESLNGSSTSTCSEKKATIVCCSDSEDENETWFANDLPDDQITWYFSYCKKFGIFDRLIKRPNLGKLYSSFQAARLAKRKKADLVVSHEAELTFWSTLFCRLLGVRVDHVAMAFNYPFMPNPIRRYWMTQVFKHVGQFVVSSTMEKELYHQYFDIPRQRIDVRLWKMGVIHYAPDTSLEAEDYICALGQFGRDYATLFAAMEQLPEIKLVVVARPDNVEGLNIPPNVKVCTNVPGLEAMNILKFSRFMVLPLADSQMPTGHITLVASMHLGKAAILANSSGISDYFQAGQTALTYEVGNPNSLATVIRQLWSQPETCENLGQNAQMFSAQHCSEERAIQEIAEMLAERNLLVLS
jgi:glycosyltransferase involved in cell wall biosynthesis